jgi:HK97 family phage major capsid protein
VNISALQAHIKGLNEKLEKAADEAAEKGGFGDRVTEVKGLAAELAAARETMNSLMESKSIMDSIKGIDVVEEKASDDTFAKTLGEFVVKAAGSRLRQLKGTRGNSVATPEWLGTKAEGDTHKIPQGALAWSTEFIPGLVTTRRRLQVADLFAQGTTDTAAVSWLIEGSLEGNVAFKGETEDKPQFHLGDPTVVTSPYKKICGYVQYSDEMLEDFAFLVSEINGRGVYQLQLAEEYGLLQGTGTGADIRGVLNTSGVQAVTKGTDTEADAIFKGISAIGRSTGYTADAVVVNPAVYEKLRLAKDQAGQYYGGGMFSGSYNQDGLMLYPNLWGLTTVVTPAMSADTALVGAFKSAATLYRRGGVRVETTTSHGDNFVKDIVTTRLELRELLAVRQPLAFAKVDLSK